MFSIYLSLFAIHCNTNLPGGLWIGLQNNNGWEWVAGDEQYDENSVNWVPNAPRPNGGDCAFFITGGPNAGRITNSNGYIDCTTSTKRYCCNPLSGTSNPSPSPSPAPTNNPTPAPTDNPTTPQTSAPTLSPTDPTVSPTQSPTSPTGGPTRSPTDNPTVSGGCPRIRREWNTMSQSDRDLYINGFLQLASNGVIAKFTDQHADVTAEEQAHVASTFLPWHRLFLFELETQFRNLGGQYACFGLPYWNWGEDRDEYVNNYRSWTILNSGLGGAGDANDNYCVTDGAFTADVYTPTNCPNSWQDSQGRCCLRRTTYADGTNTGMYTTQMNDDAVMASTRYGRDNGGNGGARREIEFGPHGLAHCTFGICGGGHLGDGFRSPDDPIFYLLHGMVDWLWALWQDVNDYEQVDKASLTRTHYNGQLTYSDIDFLLEFDVLEAESWSTLDGTATSRDMHSIQDTSYLGYTYEYGSFFDRQQNFPTNLLDSTWFYDDPNSRRRRRRLRKMRESSTRKFTDLAYQQLESQYGDDAYTLDGRRELVKTLTKMECEFDNTGGYECERPAYFDDCSDMELGYNIYNNKPDVNLTLAELIEKVKDYPCMVETRKMMYPWVSQVGGIWRYTIQHILLHIFFSVVHNAFFFS